MKVSESTQVRTTLKYIASFAGIIVAGVSLYYGLKADIGVNSAAIAEHERIDDYRYEIMHEDIIETKGYVKELYDKLIIRE